MTGQSALALGYAVSGGPRPARRGQAAVMARIACTAGGAQIRDYRDGDVPAAGSDKALRPLALQGAGYLPNALYAYRCYVSGNLSHMRDSTLPDRTLAPPVWQPAWHDISGGNAQQCLVSRL
jgi:hypothetical protein